MPALAEVDSQRVAVPLGREADLRADARLLAGRRTAGRRRARGDVADKLGVVAATSVLSATGEL